MQNTFIDGMTVKRPNEKAPKFIKARISVNVEKFLQFAEAHKNKNGWVDMDLKESTSGNLYLSLYEWKPRVEDTKEVVAEEARSLDIPF